MLQVSQIAYMSGGAFLGLAYWDLPYHLLALAILANRYVATRVEGNEKPIDIRQKARMTAMTGRA